VIQLRTELLSLHSGTIDARQSDLEPAGRLAVDGPLLTSRSPADLKSFCPAIVEHFAHARADVG
jgi:hypothetical protein